MSRVLEFMSNVKNSSGAFIVIILLRQMHIAATSLLRDSYHHSSKLFQFFSFTVSSYFIYSMEVIVHWIFFVVLHISVL
jgi:hypothetical protein